MYLLRQHMVHGTATSFAKMLKEIEMENVLDHQLLYALSCDAYNQRMTVSGGIAAFAQKPVVPQLFAEQGTSLTSQGRCASAGYYLDRFKVSCCFHLILMYSLKFWWVLACCRMLRLPILTSSAVTSWPRAARCYAWTSHTVKQSTSE